MNTESEYWLKEADKIIAAYLEKHRDYHAMQLRHSYERGQYATEHPAEKMLGEIRETLAERLDKIRRDSDKEPHRRNAECDTKTEDALDMIIRSIKTYEEGKTLAEPANDRAMPPEDRRQ